MKTIKLYFFSIIILLLSFYLTNSFLLYQKNNNPLMLEIKQSRSKYYKESIDAVINENKIIPGISGQDVDFNESYSNMKEYGNYNETLTVFKEIKPTISIDDNYNKYIIHGNKTKKEVSLIIKLNNNYDLTNILEIIKRNDIDVTFFIDGTYLEKNLEIINRIKEYELEVLSYNNSYNINYLKTTISYLESLTKKKTYYCYTELENNDLLKTCIKLKKHTIIPNLVINKDLYKTVKNNIENSMIISLENNNYIEKELSTTIKYIKSKGYNFVSLKTLLSEN